MTTKLSLAFSNQVLLQYYIWKCKWRYPIWTWKKCALTVSYVIFTFASSIALFSSRKKWLIYLPHAISPYLNGKLLNWKNAFSWRFCWTVLPRILNWTRLFQLFVFVNYSLCFFICNFTLRGICINFDNQQIYSLINLYFLAACLGQPKSVLTRYLGTFLGFQTYWTFYCSVTYLVA